MHVGGVRFEKFFMWIFQLVEPGPWEGWVCTGKTRWGASVGGMRRTFFYKSFLAFLE